MVIVHLVRHGQSVWNARGLVQGQRGPGLTDLGRQQARAAGLALSDRTISYLYSSPLLRATQTARILGDVLGIGPVLDPRLREQGHGSWEGRSIDSDDPGDGESGDDLTARLTAFLSDLPTDGEVVLVSHGDAIPVLAALLDGRRLGLIGNGEIVSCE